MPESRSFSKKKPGRIMAGKLDMIPRRKKSSEIRGTLCQKKIRCQSMARIDERPKTSPEAIRVCLAKVEIALMGGHEQQALSAIRNAFANGLCPSEPHDPRDLGDDEPLASTILGGGLGVEGDQQAYARLLDMLERYGFLTVGQVRSVGYAGIMKIPFISNRYADIIAEAVGINAITNCKTNKVRRRSALSH